MFNKIKSKITITLAILSMLFTYTVTSFGMELVYDGKSHVYNVGPITLRIEGSELLNLSMPPIIMQNYTLVPSREVFEPLGASVFWNEVLRQVNITYEDKIITLTVDGEIAIVNGEERKMDIPAKIVNDKLMVPVRFISESAGLEIFWNGDNREIDINKIPKQDIFPVFGEPLNTEVTILEEEPPIIVEPVPIPQLEIPLTVEADEPQIIINTPIPTDSSHIVGKARDMSVRSIETQSYTETNIVSINPTYDKGGNQGFIINASSAISRVEKNLLPDNRLVIDIYNSEMKIEDRTIKSDSPAVSEIRANQFQIEPEKISRVVFDLDSAIEFSVDISPNRTSISVMFQKDTISGVAFSSDGVSDFVNITFQHSPSLDVRLLGNPSRLVIESPFSIIENEFKQQVDGKLVSNIKAEQLDTAAKITLDLNEAVLFSVSSTEKVATVRISQPAYKNIEYDSLNKTLILKKGEEPINAFDLLHTDNYGNLEYIMSFQEDLEYHFGYGEISINDERLNSISLQTNSNGNTQFIVKTNEISATIVSEDEEHIRIKFVHPKEKYSKIVVVDPGHGGHDVGASGYGMHEKDIVLDISNRVVSTLERDEIVKVYTTRSTDVYVERPERARFGSEYGDLFVSIHVNAAYRNTAPNGTETFFSKLNNNTKGITSEQVANIMHKHLINDLKLTDRKVKSENFEVLRLATVPAVLLELAFLSNAGDAVKLADNEFRERSTNAIVKGIYEVFENYSPRV